MRPAPLPKIIQGGMGLGVSAWPLANAVSKAGQLGVVAGSGLDTILARRLQLGDPGGHIRRALAHFPVPDVAQRILDRYFLPGGKDENTGFKSTPVFAVNPSQHLEELIVAANFVEVFLAREGHDNPVGINYLEKIQLPTLQSLFGAMLAGVGFVLMGAGIPTAIPGILDLLSLGEAVRLRLDVKNTDPDEAFYTHFDPKKFCGGKAPKLERPQFLAIISTTPMARIMAKKSSGVVNGFIIEGPLAGGHNAPPRGRLQLSDSSEPIYGERDVPDLAVIDALGLPFWLAGSYAGPERLSAALDLGAVGVQVGTAFAYCEESGMASEIKERVLELSRHGKAQIFTDSVASPTGFPFKVVQLSGTTSEQDTYEQRSRVCDVGYLRTAYKQESGALVWRCPSEPEKQFVRKGGDLADTVGRKCVCNGLMAAVGLGQIRKGGYHEAPMVTSGNEVVDVARFLAPGASSFRASDVIAHLLGELRTS